MWIPALGWIIFFLLGSSMCLIKSTNGPGEEGGEKEGEGEEGEEGGVRERGEGEGGGRRGRKEGKGEEERRRGKRGRRKRGKKRRGREKTDERMKRGEKATLRNWTLKVLLCPSIWVLAPFPVPIQPV